MVNEWRYSTFAFLFAFLPLIGGNAIAATMSDALAQYDKGNFKGAAESIRSLSPVPAQGFGALCEMAVRKLVISNRQTDLQACKEAVGAGDPNGLVWYGIAQFDGNEWLAIEKNQTLGLGYLAEAVQANYPVASSTLCEFYYKGGDFARATSFCKVAAASKIPKGLYYLALMSLEGKGSIQDFEKGKQFALASASFNSENAYNLLGNIARDGAYGTSKDLIAAYSWYVLATAAAPNWSEPKKARDELKLSQEQISAAQKLANDWKGATPPSWWELYPKTAAVASVDRIAHSEESPKPSVVQAQPAAKAADAGSTGLEPDAVRLFMDEWFKASTTAKTPDDILRFYGPEVDYYKRGVVSKGYIESDKKAYFNRWPMRSWKAGDMDVKDGKDSSEKVVTFQLSYQVENAAHETKEGTVPVTLTIASREGRILIIGERN